MIFDAAGPDLSGGHDDHIVDWQRPRRPTWMDEATYATIPETLTVRELRFNVDNPGFRTREIVVATTLLDENTYRKDEIADLYHQRWHAEIFHPDYRSSASLYPGVWAA